MAFNVGDKVKVKEPFSFNFSGTYTVLALSAVDANTYTIDLYNDGVGSDFADIYLEAA